MSAFAADDDPGERHAGTTLFAEVSRKAVQVLRGFQRLKDNEPTSSIEVPQVVTRRHGLFRRPRQFIMSKRLLVWTIAYKVADKPEKRLRMSETGVLYLETRGVIKTNSTPAIVELDEQTFSTLPSHEQRSILSALDMQDDFLKILRRVPRQPADDSDDVA